MKQVMSNIKSWFKSTFTGQEGSVLWLIQWTAQFIKESIEAINEQFRYRRAERDHKRHSDDE